MIAPGPYAPPETPVVPVGPAFRPWSWWSVGLGAVGTILWPLMIGTWVAAGAGVASVPVLAVVAMAVTVAVQAHRGRPLAQRVVLGLPITGALSVIPILPLILGGVALSAACAVTGDGGQQDDGTFPRMPGTIILAIAVYASVMMVLSAGLGHVRLTRITRAADRSRS